MIRIRLRKPATTNFKQKVGQLLSYTVVTWLWTWFLAGATDFSPLQCPNWVPEPPSSTSSAYQRVSLLGIKRLRNRSDHSPPTSTNTKNLWRYTSTILHTFTTLCLSMGASCNNSYTRQFCIQVRPSKSLSSIISALCPHLISDFQHIITFVCQVLFVFTSLFS